MQHINKNMSPPALTAILFFFSFFFTFTAINAQTPEAVLDSQGNPVQVGVGYRLLPPIRPFGGLGLGPNRNHTICPLSVVQMRPLRNGLPIYFAPVHQPTEGVVLTSTDYTLWFNFSAISMAAMWKREPLDQSVGKYFITSDFVFNNSHINGSQTIENHFKIELVSGPGIMGLYKLSWCPTVCSTCEKVLCKDIGVHFDEDKFSRLALSDDFPYVFSFVRKAQMEQINAL
ncbi:hypothetical protein Sjap_011667 [Stephania japonica]|uniref:Uncharacterized protein n=1 Tax=Stephania japonica TaxID=461633 RepID=A0AAP0JCT6_9MAGN